MLTEQPSTALTKLPEPPLESLTPFEQRAVRLANLLLHRAYGWQERYIRGITVKWMTLGSKRMVIPHGLERLRGLTPKDGILIVSNHRSFFDLFELGLCLEWYTDLRQPYLCPVRADFFYERPLGMAVNLLVSAGRMFPPFFRDPAKAEFNQWALSCIAERLQRGEVVVGFHPEGRRNKGPDPYAMLPAKPGIGKLIMDSWPIVVPAFINGMSYDILSDIRNNWVGKRRCIAVFGEPIDLSPFRALPDRLASHKKIADHLVEAIRGLGEEERRLRAELGVE